MIEYLRRTSSGAAGNGLGTTIKYLRFAAGNSLSTTTMCPRALGPGSRHYIWRGGTLTPGYSRQKS
jgi:hypothetical protein